MKRRKYVSLLLLSGSILLLDNCKHNFEITCIGCLSNAPYKAESFLPMPSQYATLRLANVKLPIRAAVVVSDVLASNMKSDASYFNLENR